MASEHEQRPEITEAEVVRRLLVLKLLESGNFAAAYLLLRESGNFAEAYKLRLEVFEREGHLVTALEEGPVSSSQTDPFDVREPGRSPREADQGHVGGPPLTSGGETTPGGSTSRVSNGPGVLYHDAVIWIFISSFVGLAISQWALTPPWMGALIGGGLAFIVSALLLSRYCSADSDQTVIASVPKGVPGESPHRVGQ